MRSVLVTFILGIALSTLVLQQTLGITRSPEISNLTFTPPSSGVTARVLRSVSFHSILFAYANYGFRIGGFGFRSPKNGSESLNSVPLINDEDTWSKFWGNTRLMACGWPPGRDCPSSPPQMDFTTRTVLLVSPGSGTWGVGFSLVKVVGVAADKDIPVNSFDPALESIEHLELDGVALGLRSGCYYISLAVVPFLIVDVPKTDLPAILHYTVREAPSCLGTP